MVIGPRQVPGSSSSQSAISNRQSPIALLALLLLAGCSLDPTVFHGYGTAPPPRQEPRTAAAPQPKPGDKPPFGATPRRDDTLWGMPGDKDLLARSPDNVAIIVEKLDATAASATDLGGSFRARDGDLTVSGGNPLAARNGLQLRLATGSFTGRLGASATRSRASSRDQMFIVVKSGTEGALVMGSDVWVTRLGYWTPAGYVLLAEREFVGRQLAVRPTILPGGQITIELWPRFSTRRGRLIDVTQLATRVTVRDGQSLILGGLNTAGSEVAAALFSASSRERSSTSAIVLTARIGGLDIEWPRGR